MVDAVDFEKVSERLTVTRLQEAARAAATYLRVNIR